MKVSEIMSTNLITCNEDCTIKEVAAIMLKNNISVLPITNANNELAGIITESDFVSKNANIPHALASIKSLFGQDFYLGEIEEVYKKSQSKKVSEVMSKNVITTSKNSSITQLVDLMNSKNLKRVPVIDNDKLVGIVTRRDLIKAFVNIKS